MGTSQKRKQTVQIVRTPERVIHLDKPRTLRFDLNALAALEDVYGNFFDAVKGLQQGSMKAMRAMLWAGLVHEDPALTLERVGSMISPYGGSITGVAEMITECLISSLPETEEAVEENEAEQEAAGTADPT